MVINKSIYTAKDIKEILQCSISQAYNIMAQRKFPSFKIGKRVYVRKEAFEHFIRAQESKF